MKDVFLPVRRPRPWGRVLQACAVLAAVPLIVLPFALSDVFDLPVVGEYLVGPTILKAVWGTLSLATLSTALAIVLGTGVALLRVSDNPVLRWASGAYVFRGTPMLVQLLIWFYAVPRVIGDVGLAVPGTDWVLVPTQPASTFFTKMSRDG